MKKITKTDTEEAKSTNNNNANKPPPTTHTEENKAEIDGDNNKAPPVAIYNAETAHETEALHAASKDNGGDQQPNNGERKDYSQQTSKSDEGGAFESSSDRNHSSTQGLTTPVKGTTVSKNGIFNFEKKKIFFFLYI